MVSVAGAGPPPIDAKLVTPETLSNAITFLLSPSALAAAGAIAEKMRSENGVKEAVASFHRQLSLKDMSCSLIQGNPATWVLKGAKKNEALRLSHRAASVLVEEKTIDVKDLRL
jgi:sterol 3beta-glucosyltransferase